MFTPDYRQIDRCQELDRAAVQLRELAGWEACESASAAPARCSDSGNPEVVISLEYVCHGYSFRELAGDLERKLQRTAELIRIRKAQWKST